MLFPFTHILFARNILGKLNNEIILGAVFPDAVISGFIDHEETHQKNLELYNYLNRTGVFRDFARAAITHGTRPKGLDYFCDEKYIHFERGYAFETSRPLVNKVVKCCNLPEEMGLWKAHNFIEMAVELWIYQQNKSIYNCFAEALEDQNLILALSQMLAPFYDAPAAKVAMSFPVYGEYVIMPEVTPLELANKYAAQTYKKHCIKINVNDTAEVIEEALELIKPSIVEFLEYAKQQVSLELERLTSRNY